MINKYEILGIILQISLILWIVLMVNTTGFMTIIMYVVALASYLTGFVLMTGGDEIGKRTH